MSPQTLHLEEPVVEVLSCALLQAIDDLEARAILCRRHDPVLGAISAEEYRTDARRLQRILEAIAPGSRPPDPERVAVLWIDGTWTVCNDRAVRLHRSDDIEALLETTLDLVDHHLLHPHDALTALHHIVTHDTHDTHDLSTHDLSTHDDTRSQTDHDPNPNVRTTTEHQSSTAPTHKRSHRLAPGCQPGPDRVAERGADQC